MDFEQFISAVKQNGLEYAKKTLRQWVEEGQSESFCDGATSRAMCREASDALTGEKSRSYIESKHGVDLYNYMWHIEQ